DPLGPRREAVAGGADLVLEELAKLGESDEDTEPDEDPEGWAADTDVLLAERARGQQEPQVVLPDHLSVSQLVDLAADPGSLARGGPRPGRPTTCPSASSSIWRPPPARWPAGYAGRCRKHRTPSPGAARPSTPGSSDDSVLPGCWSSTTCPARPTPTRRRTPI